MGNKIYLKFSEELMHKSITLQDRNGTHIYIYTHTYTHTHTLCSAQIEGWVSAYNNSICWLYE